MQRNLSAVIINIALAIGQTQIVNAEVLVHETFSDNDIADGSPAVWQGACFQWECGPDPPTADFSVDNGEFDLTVRDFAFWRLAEVDGVELEPRDTWSIRGRIEPQRGDDDKFFGRISIVGVGTDQYYWAAGVNSSASTESHLSNGRFTDFVDAPDRDVPFFEEWAVQIDVYPDHLESHRWLLSDPSDVASVSWSNGSPIVPGLPTIWGNWGGNSAFHEVVVATEPMGVGGDFDRDGELNLTDVEALSDVIRTGSDDPRYNLTSDEVVDELDLGVWVQQIRKTYLGDANLDGQVDGEDLNALALNWRSEQIVGWAQGDFTADGNVDSDDLNLLALNWQSTNAVAAASAVPEPSSAVLSFFGFVALLALRNKPRFMSAHQPPVV